MLNTSFEFPGTFKSFHQLLELHPHHLQAQKIKEKDLISTKLFNGKVFCEIFDDLGHCMDL